MPASIYGVLNMIRVHLCVIAMSFGCVAHSGYAIAADRVSRAAASEDLGVTPQLRYAVTSGAWARDDMRGQFRVLVLIDGFDTITSRVVVQAVSEPTRVGNRIDPPRIFAATELREVSGWTSVGEPTIARAGGEWTLTIAGVRTTVPGSFLCRYRLREDGTAQLRECEPRGAAGSR